MALRLVQFILPLNSKSMALDILGDTRVAEFWLVDIGEGRAMVSVLLESEDTEALMDKFSATFSEAEGYRAMIIEVLAFTPHKEGGEQDRGKKDDEKDKNGGRVNREELYAIMADFAEPSRAYVALMLLSVVVASIGILENSITIIIGAAVINPLLRPNMALSLATNLADPGLAKRSITALLLGIAITVVISFIVGLLFGIDPFTPEVLNRRDISLGEIMLAIASGAAAALLITLRSSASLVGIAVAVALLPPLIVFGLTLGSGHADLSAGPLLLFITDWIAINLAGVFTFFALGVRPSNWWEADKARRSTTIALCVWAVLLAVMAASIILSQ